MKSAWYHIAVLLLGMSGVFLGTLPDLIPAWIPLAPYTAALESGHEKLTAGTLRPTDDGFEEIYELLGTFQPNWAPPLLIVVKTELSFTSAGVELPAFQTARFYYGPKQDKPVCFMRDVAFLVRDAKFRWWTRFGFSITFAALILQIIPWVKAKLSKKKGEST